MGTRALGYARVSTREQATSGYGLDAQERAIRELCAQREWELVAVTADAGASATSLDRPGLKGALEQLAAGEAEVLVVAKLDRLSRSVIDFGLLLEWFRDARVQLVAMDLGVDTSTPGGRLVANVLASVAEWEADTIAQRTSDGLGEARAQGKPTGPPTVSDQPELVARIVAMRAADMSLQAIADQLNADRVPTPRGGARWRPSSLQAILGTRRRRRNRRHPALPPIGRTRQAR